MRNVMGEGEWLGEERVYRVENGRGVKLELREKEVERRDGRGNGK